MVPFDVVEGFEGLVAQVALLGVFDPVDAFVRLDSVHFGMVRKNQAAKAEVIAKDVGELGGMKNRFAPAAFVKFENRPVSLLVIGAVSFETDFAQNLGLERRDVLGYEF